MLIGQTVTEIHHKLAQAYCKTAEGNGVVLFRKCQLMPGITNTGYITGVSINLC